MTYDYRIMAHFGGYRCTGCKHRRPSTEFEITGLDHESGKVTIQHCNEESRLSVRLALPSLTGAYNLTAAIAAIFTASTSLSTTGSRMIRDAAGESVSGITTALDLYELKSGRAVSFNIGKRNGTLLVSKHENSLGYDQSLQWAVRWNKPCTIIIIVDAISRRYYTSEASWLWDINFDLLEDDCVNHIVLAGRYINELAMRFSMTAVDPDKVSYIKDLGDLPNHIECYASGEIYALTCFADKAKFMSVCEPQKIRCL
jgi:Cu/Ag efflux protein CusF